MGSSAKIRRAKFIAKTKLHSLLDAEQYGRLLYLKNKDYYNRIFISYGLFPSDEDAEVICGNLFREVWKNIGKCIYHDVEVRVGKNSRLGKQLFTIQYAKRDSPRAQNNVRTDKGT
jgi:hypothetical protein